MTSQSKLSRRPPRGILRGHGTVLDEPKPASKIGYRCDVTDCLVYGPRDQLTNGALAKGPVVVMGDGDLAAVMRFSMARGE